MLRRGSVLNAGLGTGLDALAVRVSHIALSGRTVESLTEQLLQRYSYLVLHLEATWMTRH